jgi:hypothetical protein
MSKTVWSITKFLCWVFVLVVGTANAPADEQGPLHVQNRYPLYLIFLTPEPDTPNLIGTGQWLVSFNADYTSVYINEQSSFMTAPLSHTKIPPLDQNSLELALGVSYSVSNRLVFEFAFCEDLTRTAPDFTVHGGLRLILGKNYI